MIIAESDLICDFNAYHHGRDIDVFVWELAHSIESEPRIRTHGRAADHRSFDQFAEEGNPAVRMRTARGLIQFLCDGEKVSLAAIFDLCMFVKEWNLIDFDDQKFKKCAEDCLKGTADCIANGWTVVAHHA